ncbi:hypothetical protein [Streptomyces sp. NBC_00280]|uniref:hypothetical protein n=1 Tax=Streptomyces sp. NBC_00280 TaxID=2975699 RepID=UPI00324F519C
MTPEEKRAFKKETRRAAKAAKSSGRQAERALAKYGMGPFSRMMELSVGDAESWVTKSIPSVHPPSDGESAVKNTVSGWSS